MKFNSKLTWGLAWAGLVLVVAVPSADFLTGKAPGQNALTATSGMDAAQPLPATKPAAGGGSGPDPVDALLAKGKKLPAYISGGAGTDAAQGAAGPATENARMATVDPSREEIAPTPYPLSARPSVASEAPLIVDETRLAQQEAEIDVTGSIGGDPQPSPDPVALADYLARSGLLADGNASGQTDAGSADAPSSSYDPDGFFLSDGPNAVPGKRSRFNPDELEIDGWGFTLF